MEDRTNSDAGDKASLPVSGADKPPPGSDSGCPPITAAGWYLDPQGNGGLRWWDGVRWTDEMADGPSSEPVPLEPESVDLGDRPNGQAPARRTYRKVPLITLGIGVLIGVGTATVVWALVHNNGSRSSAQVSAPITTMTAAAPAPVGGSSPPTVTLDISDGQDMLFKPAQGLLNGQVIHIVATGFTPGLQYGSMECKAGSFVESDCDVSGFQTATANTSCTLTIDYTALKGPFGSHNIVCKTAETCEIGIAPIEGNNYSHGVTVSLGFR
jgi:hypothetical protein